MHGHEGGAAVTAPQSEHVGSLPHARRAVMVRRLDSLGRIVLPKEFRRSLGIADGAALTIEETPGGIILRPWEASCGLCGGMPEEGVYETRQGQHICRECAKGAAELHGRLSGEGASL